MPECMNQSLRTVSTAPKRSCHKTGFGLLYLVLAVAFVFPAAGNGAEMTGKGRVLVLNSYHQGYTWGDNETAGVLDALKAANVKADPLIEYLDTKQLPKQEHFPQLLALYRAKYATSPPDVVLTMDDPAFDFALKYRQQLFAGKPIVFIGVNAFQPAMLGGEKNVTGAMEQQDFRGTVEAALSLQPETREVVVVHDYTPSGLATQREVMHHLAPLSGRISVRFLPEMTIDQILAALGELRSGSIVLAVSFGVDKAGRVFNHSELARLLSEKSPVPVYSTKVERLGHGIVGGSLMDGHTHGVQGGELALEVLRQGSAAGVPVVEYPRSELMFDYRQLVRFKIPVKRLPQGSKLVNRPQSFYGQHGQVINVALLIIGVLSASLVMVVVANRRRLKAEEELLESRSYQVLFENASDPIFILDCHGHLLESSSVARDMFKLGGDDGQSRLLTELASGEDVDNLRSFLQQIRKEGRGLFKTAFNVPQGESIPVEISCRAINYRGEESIFCSVRDIRERVIYEEKLRQLNNELERRIKERTKELTQVNRDLSSFCYAISHELLAPVARLKGFSQLLQEDLGENPDEAMYCAARIVVASEKLQQVIDSVLQLSRLAQSSFSPMPLNLSSMAREIAAEQVAGMPDRHIEVTIADGITADGDLQLVRLCLVNLIGNALKYSAHRATARVEFGFDPGQGALFVRDNGVGFDMINAERVFEPFIRLHREEEFAGSGIGLATVARIIELHGGRIWAEAAPDRGATFYFTLSAVKELS